MNELKKEKLNKKLAGRVLKYLIVKLRGKPIEIKELKSAKFSEDGFEREDYVCKTRTSDGMKKLILEMEKSNLVEINRGEKEHFTDYEIKLAKRLNDFAVFFAYRLLGAELMLQFVFNKKRKYREWCFDIWNLSHKEEERIAQKDIFIKKIGKIGQAIIIILYESPKPLTKREIEKEIGTNSIQVEKWLSFLKNNNILFERYSEGSKVYLPNKESSLIRLFSTIPKENYDSQELFLSNTIVSGEVIVADLEFGIRVTDPELAKLLPNM